LLIVEKILNKCKMDSKISEKIDEALREGEKHEVLFFSLAERNGYTCKISTKHENTKEHWDVEITKNGISRTVDVKGLKDSIKDNKTWFEFKNVNGDVGWGCAPELHTIAFELDKMFILMKRSEVLSVVEERVREFEAENGVGICFYKELLHDYEMYSRVFWGRKDKIVKVPLRDLKHLIYEKIYK